MSKRRRREFAGSARRRFLSEYRRRSAPSKGCAAATAIRWLDRRRKGNPARRGEVSIFTFDPQSHSYFLDGVQIPGVTRVLREAGLVSNYGGFSGPQKRGLYVHTACEYL